MALKAYTKINMYLTPLHSDLAVPICFSSFFITKYIEFIVCEGKLAGSSFVLVIGLVQTLPAQWTPSPVNPVMHSHSNEPILLVQVANFEQLSVSWRHSSTSGKKNE